MTSLADKAILFGANNRPSMLEKDMYDSWKSRMEMYMLNKQHGRMILESVEQADCDVKATNIILQGLPPEVYALERECKLYDEFDKFTYKKGETLCDFYLRFSLLLNDMNMYNMKLEQFQVNTKFLNTLPPEWMNDTSSTVNHNAYMASSSAPQIEYAPMNFISAGLSRPFTSRSGGAPCKQRVIVCYNYKDCDKLNSAKIALMANLTHYGSDNLAE
nr:hypothetical protein [Tanacetum cinerariifolium]